MIFNEIHCNGFSQWQDVRIEQLEQLRQRKNYINNIVFAHDSSEIIEQTETRTFKARELKYHTQEIIVVTVYNDYYTYRIMEVL